MVDMERHHRPRTVGMVVQVVAAVVIAVRKRVGWVLRDRDTTAVLVFGVQTLRVEEAAAVQRVQAIPVVLASKELSSLPTRHLGR